MVEAVIVDLVHDNCLQYEDCVEKRLSKAADIIGSEQTKDVYLMFNQNNPTTAHSCKSLIQNLLKKFDSLKEVTHILSQPCVASSLYCFKQAIDKANLCTVKIITSAQGKTALEAYVDLLFTAVYSFEYEVVYDNSHCPGSDPPTTNNTETFLTGEQLQHAREEVSTFLRQLPALKGDITILRSPLISGDHFLHGFTTRTGGISYIETLSSLNLFSSSKRRDPKSVVAENIRRLALEAGFDETRFHLVKVAFMSRLNSRSITKNCIFFGHLPCFVLPPKNEIGQLKERIWKYSTVL